MHQAPGDHPGEVSRRIGMLTADRQDCRQVVLQVTLGAVAGLACRHLGKVGPPIDEKEFTGER